MEKGVNTQKVYVGLSGGVDSAVSAALLQQQGYDVTGVFIRIALPGYPCTAGEDKIEAQRVAAHLSIKFKAVDLSTQYKEEVFAYTLDEFKKGRTPNPDTLCNQKVKFGAFFDWCIKDGADKVATGHYAQTKDGKLFKGLDDNKDQSYFLWMVPREALEKTLFPVGNITKPRVRALAAEFNLPNAKRRDSQGLCFLGGITIEDMLTRELNPTPGDVLNEKGEVVGKHSGSVMYTLGQRHGFELFPSSGGQVHTDTEPHFVIGKNAEQNTVTVSPVRLPVNATKTKLTLESVNWISKPEPNKEYEARFRYRQTLIPAIVVDERSLVLFEPYYVPLGQSLVLYTGNECLGGGAVDNSSVS